jgi:DNA-binding GntR family transcriptional regulator
MSKDAQRPCSAYRQSLSLAQQPGRALLAGDPSSPCPPCLRGVLFRAAGMTESANEQSAARLDRRLLPEQIVARLRAEIVAGAWAPGERVTEQILSQRFGVSRTPLREAMKLLAAEGLLSLLPNRGAVVTEPTIEDAQDKLRVLGALEALAAALACTAASAAELEEIAELHERMMAAHQRGQAKRYYELNDRIHRAIAAAAHSRTVQELHESLSRHVDRARHIANFREDLSDDSKAEHEAIIAALMRRDAAAAKAAVERHITTVLHKMAPHAPEPAA